jgi:hypothetical protein
VSYTWATQRLSQFCHSEKTKSSPQCNKFVKALTLVFCDFWISFPDAGCWVWGSAIFGEGFFGLSNVLAVRDVLDRAGDERLSCCAPRNSLGEQTVTYFNLAQLLSAAAVILFVGGLYKALGGKWFAPEPKPKEPNEPNQDSRFKLLGKLVDFWIAFGALVLLILVLSLAFVLWAIL